MEKYICYSQTSVFAFQQRLHNLRHRLWRASALLLRNMMFPHSVMMQQTRQQRSLIGTLYDSLWLFGESLPLYLAHIQTHIASYFKCVPSVNDEKKQTTGQMTGLAHTPSDLEGERGSESREVDYRPRRGSMLLAPLLFHFLEKELENWRILFFLIFYLVNC